MLLNYTVPPEDEGRTLNNILRTRLRLSATLLRRLKAASAVFVDGQPRHTDHRVSAGERVGVEISEPEADYPPEPGELDVIFEDEWLLALNKPSGMLIHPSHSRNEGTLANRALYHVLSQGGAACHAVNRLDRDTGGVVLFSKSGYVKNLMTGAITFRGYTAAVCGTPDSLSGSIELPIRRVEEGNMLRAVLPDGAYARTDYRTAATDGSISLLRLSLFTGRTHQIRVHCRAMGFPVLGDRLYCDAASARLSERLGISSQLLFADRLDFTHPVSGTSVSLTLRPPWESEIASLIFRENKY
ncbi:MAG: RluA family pseudouridine synthase [Oscillospiraceae bacterium]|nr:RluA family pseudouridine synthase [Oscillospiraceae bacterium]